jgi:hypothetical protein
VEENDEQQQQQQNANATTAAKFFFYIVDLYQACHVLDEANWKWVKWQSDWSMVNIYSDYLVFFIEKQNFAQKPSEKHFMCRDRFDTGILLVNDIEECYVKMQLIPSQQRCRFILHIASCQ